MLVMKPVWIQCKGMFVFLSIIIVLVDCDFYYVLICDFVNLYTKVFTSVLYAKFSIIAEINFVSLEDRMGVVFNRGHYDLLGNVFGLLRLIFS